MRLRVERSVVVAGSLRPLGDKSVAHRALALAALASRPSRVKRWLRAGVTQAMVGALSAVGVVIEEQGEGPDASLWVQGVGNAGFSPAETELDCGRSGATLRFLMGLLAASPGPFPLGGHPSLCRRPMERVIQPLERMGAQIHSSEGRAPLVLCGGLLGGLNHRLSVASAQVETALLLAGLQARGAVELTLPGPARDHSGRLLRHLGIPVLQVADRVELAPGPWEIPGFEIELPGDFSSAAFPITAAVTAEEADLHVASVGLNPTRLGYLDVLLRMGARIEGGRPQLVAGEPRGDLRVRNSHLRGVVVEGEEVVRMIDEFPAFVAAALAAKGRSEVRNAAELRVKESDRIRTLVQEFGRLGARIEERPDGFVIDGPQQLEGGTASARGDHRIAMALAVAGLRAEAPVVVEEAEMVAQSYPDFVGDLRKLGVRAIEES